MALLRTSSMSLPTTMDFSRYDHGVSLVCRVTSEALIPAPADQRWLCSSSPLGIQVCCLTAQHLPLARRPALPHQAKSAVDARFQLPLLWLEVCKTLRARAVVCSL